MTHLSAATKRAKRFMTEEPASSGYAIVHCGCGEFTVKALSLAERSYPKAIRRTVTAGADGSLAVTDRSHFDPAA